MAGGGGRRRGGPSERATPPPPQRLGVWRGVQRPWGVGEMAARSVGCGVRRLRSVLQGRAGPRGWPPRRAASGPRGGASCAGAALPNSYPALRALADRQPDAFWGPLARDTLVWDTPFHTVWDCDFHSGKIGWFLGGQLNVSGEWAAGTRAPPARTSRGDSERSRQGPAAGPWAGTSGPEAPASLSAVTPRPPRTCPGGSSGRPAAGPALLPPPMVGSQVQPRGAAGGTWGGLGAGCWVPGAQEPGLPRTLLPPPARPATGLGRFVAQVNKPSGGAEPGRRKPRGPAAGTTYLLVPWRCLWEGRKERRGLLALGFR